MIKAIFNNGDILFGLSEENIKRLKQDRPIMINLRDIGLLGDRKIIIVYGDTEQKIADDMKDYISDQTKIHRDEAH